jgi:hypothetical protein
MHDVEIVPACALKAAAARLHICKAENYKPISSQRVTTPSLLQVTNAPEGGRCRAVVLMVERDTETDQRRCDSQSSRDIIEILGTRICFTDNKARVEVSRQTMRTKYPY